MTQRPADLEAKLAEAERLLELRTKALRGLTDWRADKAVEHLEELVKLAKECGLAKEKRDFLDRYFGRALQIQAARAALQEERHD